LNASVSDAAADTVIGPSAEPLVAWADVGEETGVGTAVGAGAGVAVGAGAGALAQAVAKSRTTHRMVRCSTKEPPFDVTVILGRVIESGSRDGDP
jgi:hypothetical protein